MVIIGDSSFGDIIYLVIIPQQDAEKKLFPKKL